MSMGNNNGDNGKKGKARKTFAPLTSWQQDELLQILTEHPEILMGRPRPGDIDGPLVANVMEDMAVLLNSDYLGAQRSVEEWWQYLINKRNAIKSKIVNIRKAYLITGGGPPDLTKLNHFERRLAELLHPGALVGDEEVQEAAAPFLQDQEEQRPELQEEQRPELQEEQRPELQEEQRQEDLETIDLRSEDEAYMTANEGPPDANMVESFIDLMGHAPNSARPTGSDGYEPRPGPSSRPAGYSDWFWNLYNQPEITEDEDSDEEVPVTQAGAIGQQQPNQTERPATVHQQPNPAQLTTTVRPQPNPTQITATVRPQTLPTQARAINRMQTNATHAPANHPQPRQEHALDLPAGLPNLNLPRRNRRRDARQILADVAEKTLLAKRRHYRHLAASHREMMEFRAREMELEERRLALEERRVTVEEDAMNALRQILKNFNFDFFKHFSG